MSDRNCSALLAGIIGFALGAVAAQFAARFCSLCRPACCCGEAGCCGRGEGGAAECDCCHEAEATTGEAEAPAE